MKITLTRREGALFDVESEPGAHMLMEGSGEIGGGTGAALRPMETVLAALAGCSAVDVVLILGKLRQKLADLVIRVEGDRSSDVPAVFTQIRVHFEAGGEVERKHFERAVRLSMEKYCSVAAMLQKSATITWTATLRPRATE